MQRAARAYGMMDPALWLARIRNFAQPSEVQEPIELLRAGVLFHARGIVNTKAIQHNLDWVWPYWVERQFDPADVSFIPRAFSFSHINLTHRNWTAIGLPELPLYPIVDPRGLVTPIQDGWSIDCWLLDAAGHALVPSRVRERRLDSGLSRATTLPWRRRSLKASCTLDQIARVVLDGGEPVRGAGRARHEPRGRPAWSSRSGRTIPRASSSSTASPREPVTTAGSSTTGTRCSSTAPADAILVSDYAGGDVFSIWFQVRAMSAGRHTKGRIPRTSFTARRGWPRPRPFTRSQGRASRIDDSRAA